MPRDGTGTFVRNNGTHSGSTVWAQDKAASIKITAANHDAQDQDIADGITQSISKDGQTTPTANLPMGGYKLTNLGAGTARTDAANVGNVVDQTYQWGGTSSGAANVYAISLTPALTAYAAGLTVRFLSHQLNSGATTLNINSLGAVAVVKGNNVACTGGEITNGAIVEAVYETTGGGRFRLLSKHMFLDNTLYLKARNAADNAEIGLIGRDGSDNLSLYDGKFLITSGNALLPATDNAYTLGSSALELNTIYTRNLLAGAGIALNLGAANTAFWQLGTTGHMLPASDNAYNIGSTTSEVASIFGRRIGTRGAVDFSIASNNTIRWIVQSGGDLIPNFDNSNFLGSASKRIIGIYTGRVRAESGTLDIGTYGSASPLTFFSNSVSRWYVDGTSGALVPSSADTYDLGVSGGNINNVYANNLRSNASEITIITNSSQNLNLATNNTTRWKIDGSSGYLLPQVDNTYRIGDSTHLIAEIFVNQLVSSSGNDLALFPGGTRSIHFYSNGTLSWFVPSTGHISPNTDNAYDIGTTSTAPRVVYMNKIGYKGTTYGTGTVGALAGYLDVVVGGVAKKMPYYDV